LAWNSPKNKPRIQKVQTELKEFFDQSYLHDYQHWQLWYPNMDFEEEIDVLYNQIKNDKDIVIFAKSLWTILALMLLAEKWIHPSKCIFVWFPMWYVDSNEFPLHYYIWKDICPILFIQKTKDPACNFQELKKIFSEFSPKFQFQEVAGLDHDYENIQELKTLIKKFILNK
jgi:hypothetical protein